MKPGRELDALVAEKVMGATPAQIQAFWAAAEHEDKAQECFKDAQQAPDIGSHRANVQGIWHQIEASKLRLAERCKVKEYSTSIAAAWEVVEKLMKEGKPIYVYPDYDFDSCPEMKPPHAYIWIATNSDNGFYGSDLAPWPTCGDYLGEGFRCTGETAPHAVCLAALKAVE